MTGAISATYFGVSPLKQIEQECRCGKPHLHANLHRLLVARHLAHHPDDILDLLPYGCEDSDVVNAKRLTSSSSPTNVMTRGGPNAGMIARG